MPFKPCPRCGSPGGIINCSMCSALYAAVPDLQLAEEAVQADLRTREAEKVARQIDLLAAQLADKADPEKWAEVPEREKVRHRDHARIFLADVLADAAASLAA